MAANVRTEMRIPTRSAPRPPVNSSIQRTAVWNSSNDLFTSTFMQQPLQKKKPPPRPPPPKFNKNYVQNQKDRLKKPARPRELLTSLFGKKKNDHHSNTTQLHSQIHNTLMHAETMNGSVSLINLSPPESPTFTTRSSSDGLSIDSFGSDGNSNPSVFTSSGNTSQTESAFEDDFDFFGMSTKKVSQNDPSQNDPWQMMSDPFGPIEITNHNALQPVKHVGDASFFAFNTNNCNQVPFTQSCPKPVQSMPTIIRAKPPKPAAPKILQKKLGQKIDQFETQLNSLSNETTGPYIKPMTLDLTESWPIDTKDSPSPPMPTIPPPAPPSEFLMEEDSAPFTNNSKEPYGIALYDFPEEREDDLSFKEGDMIYLIKRINDDWMEGRIGSRQGIFPTNFIDIKVQLPGLPDNIVTAIYSFKGETPEDLTFNEGAKITVLSRLSQDWYYGEYDGRKGQFPINYVNRIPCNIPPSH